MLTVPAERLNESVMHDPALGDLICAPASSVVSSDRAGVGLRIVAADPPDHAAARLAARNRLPCRWPDPRPGAEALLRET